MTKKNVLDYHTLQVGFHGSLGDTSIACQRAGRSPPSPACSGSGRPWTIMWTFCEDGPIEKLKGQSPSYMSLWSFMSVIHVETNHFEEISPFQLKSPHSSSCSSSLLSAQLLSNGFDAPMWEQKHCKLISLHLSRLDVQHSHLLLRDIHQASQDLPAANSVSLLREVPSAFFVQVQRDHPVCKLATSQTLLLYPMAQLETTRFPTWQTYTITQRWICCNSQASATFSEV